VALIEWRRGVSKSRGACTPSGFQDRHNRLLCHPSGRYMNSIWLMVAIGHALTALVIGHPIDETGCVFRDGLDFGVGQRGDDGLVGRMQRQNPACLL
jgi:hypothetical protein